MKATFFGAGIPSLVDTDLRGKLIVLEGPDCVGRSTQTRLLQGWLERMGYGVAHHVFVPFRVGGAGTSAGQAGHPDSPSNVGLVLCDGFGGQARASDSPCTAKWVCCPFGPLRIHDFRPLATAVRGVDPDVAAKSVRLCPCASSHALCLTSNLAGFGPNVR